MVTEQQIKKFVEEAHRVGDALLTVCSSGNISWRVSDDEVLISGTGSWVPTLRSEQVSICCLSTGEVLNGVRPSMESVFHLGVMRERSDVGVVLHFQSPYATALACMEHPYTNLNVTAEVPIHVGREIPIIPFFRPGSKPLADHVVNAMKTHNSVLLAKHGQVTCGKDFNQAFERATFFEMAARIVILNGGKCNFLTQEELDDLESFFLSKK